VAASKIHNGSGLLCAGRLGKVVGVAVGDRSERTCRALWSSVVWRYKKATCYSDFWQAYQNVIPEAQHHAVGKESGETAHIERFNNTLRQRAGPTGCRLAQDNGWDALSAKRYPSQSASGCTSTASFYLSTATTQNTPTFGFEPLPKSYANGVQKFPFTV